MVECKEGFRRDADSGDCVKCPIGTYSDTVDAASCISCPEGKTTRYEGQRTADSCVGKGNVNGNVNVTSGLHF